jgi:hypothetical protein
MGYLGCREPFATQAPAAHFRCLGDMAATVTGLLTGLAGGFIFAAGIEAVLLTGSTGEFCLAAPPIGVCFFGPPIDVWAEAGNPLPTTITAVIIAIAAYFMRASPSPLTSSQQYTWSLMQRVFVKAQSPLSRDSVAACCGYRVRNSSRLTVS